MPTDQCVCCGARGLGQAYVLWQELIDEWRLSRYEADYINRQQGTHCTQCGSTLRSMALALAVMRCYGFVGTFQAFVARPASHALTVLEINEAGTLTQFLARLPHRTLAAYPEVDMLRLPYPDGVFDLVIHSDTLEHISEPVRALSECWRVLKPGSFCAYTVPMVVDRLTLSRAGMPPSYHGNGGERLDDFLVHTEYGCDAWKQPILAGFAECRTVVLEYPAAHAFVGVR